MYATFYSLGTYLYIYNYIPTNQAQKYFYTGLTLFEFLSFSYFLRININSKKARRIIVFASAGFTIFLLLYTAFAKIQKIDSLPIGVETILILTFSSYFMYERMQDATNLFIYNDYRFWMVLAFMLYLSGSFFIYIFADGIPRPELDQYWIFTDIFYTVKNILFSIGILIYISQQPKNPKHHVNQSSKHFTDITWDFIYFKPLILVYHPYSS